jgi:hypothetical protein
MKLVGASRSSAHALMGNCGRSEHYL